MIPQETPVENVLYWIGTVAVWAIIPATVLFVWRYARKSPWKSEPIGKAIMALMIVVGVILLVGLIYVLFDQYIPFEWVWVRAVAYPVLAVIFWRITFLLIRIQDQEREEGRPKP